MKHKNSVALKSKAFSLVELLVVVMVIAILAGMLLPALSKAKGRATRIKCANNLKNVGLAFRVFSVDHADRFPMIVSTNVGGSREFATGLTIFRHFQTMSNELATPLLLVCPSDTRPAARDFAHLSNANLSYFVGLDAVETMPQCLLSGDRNLTTNGVPLSTGVVELMSDTEVGWTSAMHIGQGNIALGDGSVQQFDQARLQEHLRNSGATNRLAIP